MVSDIYEFLINKSSCYIVKQLSIDNLSLFWEENCVSCDAFLSFNFFSLLITYRQWPCPMPLCFLPTRDNFRDTKLKVCIFNN